MGVGTRTMARKKTSNSDNTDRKQAEEALRENEERQRSLFENMLDGYAHCQMLFDDRGRPTDFVYLAVNSAFTKLTGLEDVVGRKATEVIPGIRQSHPELLEIYGRVATTGQPERFEIEFKPLGIWLAISVYSPRQGYFTAVFENITERQRATAALQQANEQLQAQTEELQVQAEELRAQAEELTSANAALREAHERAAWLARFPEENPNPVLRVSAEGTVLYCNPAAAELPGWACRTGERLGEPFWPMAARALTEGGEVRQDVELGETSYLVWAVPLPSERYVNLYGRDITERKRAEEAVQKQAALIDLTPDAIMVRAADGTIAFWSRGAEALYGWTRQEALGQSSHSLLKTRFPQPLAQMVEQMEKTGSWSGELIHCCKDGRQVTVQSRWQLKPDSGDGHREILESSVDITEQKKAQEERERLLHEVSVHAAQLQEANEKLAATNEELAASNEELRATTEELRSEIENRTKAEQALREAHERAAWLARFPEENPNPVLRVSADGTVLYCNPAAAELPGWACRTGGRLGEPFLSMVARAMTEGAEVRQDVELGETSYLVWAVPFPSERYANLYGRDITERKRAEEALRASEERFRRYFELGMIGVAITAPTKGWIEVNDECCRLLGYGRDELVRKTWAELTYPDDLGADVAQFERVLAGAIDGYTMDKRFIRKDGQVVDVTLSVSAVRGAEGAVEYFVALLQDITARKRMEDELRQSEQRERQRAEELATFLEAVPTPVIIVHDPEGTHMTGNRAADELLQHPRGAEISLSAPPEARPRHFKAVQDGRELRLDELPAQRAARGEQVRDFEFSLVFDDGTTRHLLGYGTPLRDEQGRPRGAVHVLVDITDRKRMENMLREWTATLESRVAERTAELQWRARQLQKLALELTQAEERERRRIAVILHEDLQQQIAGAKFHLSLVRQRARDDRLRAQVAGIDTMLKEAIEKSRSLSRDLSPAVLQMNDLAEVLQWLTHRIRAQQGLSIDLKSSGDMMLHSEALATFLFRAAQEMLFNVVKHAHVHEAAIRVRRFGRYVGLSVSDEGQGFDPQELKETSGIGLFSIRERTELLGGHMKVRSARGKGSRLRIVVPDSPKAGKGEGTAANAPYTSAAASPASSRGAVRVLLVDDHDVVREGLAALLREAPGIELVGVAPDGRTAINLAAELRPDVVIMDVSMPLMSGEEATRQIKSFLPRTRVIALSMYDEVEKKQKMFEAGAESYILKTVSAEELLAALRSKESDS